MSVDPVALSGTAINTLIDAELAALAADAAALEAMLETGDAVEAKVLPSNGLTDLLEIMGRRVAAALPPNLRPGDVIQTQVTGFDGGRILLQLLESETPPSPPLPSPPAEGGPPVAAAPPQGAPATTPGSPTPAQQVAPPVAVFVAAAVKTGSAVAGPPAEQPPVPGAPAGGAPPIPRTPAVPFPVAAGGQPTDIETRLAAARTAAPSSNAAAPQPAAPLPAGAQPPPIAGLPRPAVPVPGVPLPGVPVPARPFVAPPMVASAARPAVGVATPSAPAAPASTPGAPAAARSIATYQEPIALVRALHLPVTPTNVAAAKLALDSPQRLPNALATLERALPNIDDPRIATLRSVAAYVSRIEPSSPQLASQLEAFVDQVVVGSEAKLATALAARAAAEARPPAGAAPATTATSTTPGTAAPAGPAAPDAPALPVVALANAAVRALALVHDLKTQLFSVLANPPSAMGGDELHASAAGALTAITGAQLSAVTAQAAVPQNFAFTVPLWTGNGYSQAQVQVNRDAPQSPGVPLDGDNFHIAFVLETKHLGTVAIDLQTVGRTVNVAVKTEASATAERFGSSLNRLTGRLEKLRYRIASADAAVARPSSPAPPSAPPPPEPAAPGELNARA